MLRWLTVGCLVLAGCMTPAERAARMEAEVTQMIQEYGPACEKLGYKRDDDKWRDCIIRLSSKVEQRYRTYPTSTTCIGHHGFFDCTTF